MEFGIRVPFTDYLDGVSIAANPDLNDWYWFAGATITFRIEEDNKKEDPLPMITDSDEDGVPDNIDQCPDTPGKDMFDGCPDTDGDMLADKDDRCPEVPGTIYGCPDTDGDGLADIEDDCPNEKGLMVDKGCPKIDGDTDKDGVADSIDECPNAEPFHFDNGSTENECVATCPPNQLANINDIYIDSSGLCVSQC